MADEPNVQNGSQREVGIEIEEVSDAERRRADYGAPDVGREYIEGAEQDDVTARPEQETPSDSEVDAVAEEAATTTDADGEGAGGTAPASDDLDVDFPPSERLRMLEEQNRQLIADREELIRTIGSGQNRGGNAPAAGAQPEQPATPAEIQAIIDNPNTDPGVRAFLATSVATQHKQDAILRELQRVRQREEAVTASQRVESQITTTDTAVDNLVKSHPLLSNGNEANTHVAGLIKRGLMAEYTAAVRAGARISTTDVNEAFRKLLREYAPLIQKKAPKPPKDPKTKVDEAVQRKEAAAKETNAPRGGNAATTSKGQSNKEVQKLWDPTNKRRFAGLFRSAREGASQGSQRRAAGITT